MLRLDLEVGSGLVPNYYTVIVITIIKIISGLKKQDCKISATNLLEKNKIQISILEFELEFGD